MVTMTVEWVEVVDGHHDGFLLLIGSRSMRVAFWSRRPSLMSPVQTHERDSLDVDAIYSPFATSTVGSLDPVYIPFALHFLVYTGVLAVGYLVALPECMLPG